MARSNEMADDTPQPMPDIGAIRPARVDDAEREDSTTVTRMLGGADLAFAPGVASTGDARFAASGLVAATAHVLALLAVIAAPPSEFGSGGNSVDAISVSIISAAALESRERTVDVAARAASDIAPREGESETVTQAAPDKREDTAPPMREETQPEVEKEVATTPTAPEEPAPETVPDALAAPTIVPAPPKPEPVAEPKVAMVEPPPEKPEQKPGEKPKEEKPKEETSTPAADATAAGGAPSKGIEPDRPPAAAAAAARQGDANAYGMEVQAALMAVDKRHARERLAATRVKGTVVLRLVIASDGALERADIERSSGHRQLDEAAVQLVRMTAFPRPPANLNADQRAYIAPIVFR